MEALADLFHGQLKLPFRDGTQSPISLVKVQSPPHSPGQQQSGAAAQDRRS